MQSDPNKMLKKHRQLNQLDMAIVASHIQREGDEWIYNTIMLEGYDVPFKYVRKKAYKSLKGARVNVTYYPETEQVAGMDFEVMKVVRIRRSSEYMSLILQNKPLKFFNYTAKSISNPVSNYTTTDKFN